MDDPKVVVSFATNDDVDKLVVKRSDNGGIVSMISWDMAKMADEGYTEMCQKIGNAALCLLEGPHDSVFKRHPTLRPPKLMTDFPVGLVSALIDRSREEKTCAYVSAIDALLEKEANAEFMPTWAETWKHLRPELLANYPGR
jgi:hypothetical protein